MVHKIPNFASFDPKLLYNVSQMNKDNLRYVICVVFCGFWCFESLAAGAPTDEGKKEKGMQLCQPTEPNASWILPILSHFHASLAIQPRANESHIMSEDRCQKSLNLLASNDLKCRREFSHSMPKRHRHRMSKKWSIITAVIKFELMTKRQN